MKKQYQKTCPLCGIKIIVANKADIEKHLCGEKGKKKEYQDNIQQEEKTKRKKIFDI